MEERLLQLLNAEGINPTRFAEKIGVQRSSISHILTGRNKPSFDLIVKILENFPNLNAEWLLKGKGLMYKNDVPLQPSLFDPVKNNRFTDSHKDTSVHESNRELTESIGNEASRKVLALENEVEQQKVDRIVIFYSNNTFSEYFPGK